MLIFLNTTSGQPSKASPNTIDGTAHTLLEADELTWNRTTSADPVTLTVPLNDTTAIPVGTSCDYIQVGAGQITVVGESEVVVINTGETLLTRAAGSSITLLKVGVDEWDLVGDLELK